MKAIILAAGRGTRLGYSEPKPLTILKNRKTILEFQIDRLSKKVGLHNILVVVGYQKETIMERFPELVYVYNKNYSETNTSKSLLLALQKIEEDAIWMNGDVYFDEGILELIINSKYSCCLVDTKKCGPEEVKYNSAGGFIKQLSKSIENPEGEALGINLIKKKDLHRFREELEKIKKNDYFEQALENLTLANKLQLSPITVRHFFCKEIDFEEDVKSVKKYLSAN